MQTEGPVGPRHHPVLNVPFNRSRYPHHAGLTIRSVKFNLGKAADLGDRNSVDCRLRRGYRKRPDDVVTASPQSHLRGLAGGNFNQFRSLNGVGPTVFGDGHPGLAADDHGAGGDVVEGKTPVRAGGCA